MASTGASQRYVLAETMDERVAVVAVKFFTLWVKNHGPDVPPDVETCRKFIKSSVWKEALNCAYGYLHQFKSEVTIKIDQQIANDILLNGADVDLKLKLEDL